eukprot:6655384-Prymnesium_polylepis.1
MGLKRAPQPAARSCRRRHRRDRARRLRRYSARRAAARPANRVARCASGRRYASSFRPVPL